MKKLIYLATLIMAITLTGCGQKEEARNVGLSPEGVENIEIETIEIETVEIETKEIETNPISVVTYDAVTTTWEDF